MKRIMYEVKGVVTVEVGECDDIKEAIQQATLDIVQEIKPTKEDAVPEDEPEWVVYYNKEFNSLLQMGLGSGMNIDDSEGADGEYINGVWVPFNCDIVGSYYDAPDGFDPENPGELDGSCDCGLKLNGEYLEPSEPLAHWVTYKRKMGRLGTKDCLIGYLDLNGARWGIDGWKLVAKG